MSTEGEQSQTQNGTNSTEEEHQTQIGSTSTEVEPSQT